VEISINVLVVPEEFSQVSISHSEVSKRKVIGIFRSKGISHSVEIYFSYCNSYSHDKRGYNLDYHKYDLS
jgi:hypothetical protein